MCRRLLAIVFFLITVGSQATLVIAAEGHQPAPAPKVGILLVAFGSSAPSAQAAFDNIADRVRARFAAFPVRWAYTSHRIRRKLAKQGTALDSPQSALARMQNDGFTHVAVQSLHTIAGSEFHDLRRTVGAFRSMNAFSRIRLGQPLMSSQQDMQQIVKTILKIIPLRRRPQEAVVLMGHGSHHPANASYAALMFQLQLEDPNVFVGTVDGFPQVGLIKQLLLKQNLKKAYLLPFMSVAGEHAINDMAGDADDSWKSTLTQAGIECVPVLKGIAEYDGFVDLWLTHLATSLSQIN